MVYPSIDVPVPSIPAFLSPLGNELSSCTLWNRSRYTIVPEIHLPPPKSQTRLLGAHLQSEPGTNITPSVGT